MKPKLDIGILGTANIAKKYILDTIKSLEDHFIITGIASRTLENAKALAEKYKTIPYEDYDGLLQNGRLDAIYIPLPNSLHYVWVKKALIRGINVIVEKSLTCNLEDTKELVEIARNNKLVLIENFQFLHHKQVSIIKSILKENTLGDLRCVKSYFGFPPFKDQDNIRYNKTLGGGALLDAGAYPVRISQAILGDGLYVDSSSLYYDINKGVDIWGSAYLKKQNSKVTSHITFGFDNFYQNSLELWGSEGKLYTNRIFTAPPGFETQIVLETKQNGKEIINVSGDDHFKNAFLDFYHKIITKENLSTSYTNSINQSKLLEQLYLKANEQE